MRFWAVFDFHGGPKATLGASTFGKKTANRHPKVAPKVTRKSSKNDQKSWQRHPKVTQNEQKTNKKLFEHRKSEAYEFYLKGKYKWNNRKNIQDMEIAHKLIKRAIE